MTANELLKCLTDRPCSACKYHKVDGCVKWTCVFEQPVDETGEYRQGYEDGLDKALEIADKVIERVGAKNVEG